MVDNFWFRKNFRRNVSTWDLVSNISSVGVRLGTHQAIPHPPLQAHTRLPPNRTHARTLVHMSSCKSTKRSSRRRQAGLRLSVTPHEPPLQWWPLCIILTDNPPRQATGRALARSDRPTDAEPIQSKSQHRANAARWGPRSRFRFGARRGRFTEPSRAGRPGGAASHPSLHEGARGRALANHVTVHVSRRT